MALACATGVLALARPVEARTAPASARVRFNIPPQPLSQALNQLALQSNREILFSPGLTAGRRSPALTGVFTAEEALTRLLAGSGLDVRLEGRSFLILAAPRAAAPVVAAPPPPPAPPPALDSVIVTALKRSSLVQNTPISI